MIMEQLMREKLLTVKKEMEGFMKESVPFSRISVSGVVSSGVLFISEMESIKNTAVIWYALIPKES